MMSFLFEVVVVCNALDKGARRSLLLNGDRFLKSVDYSSTCFYSLKYITDRYILQIRMNLNDEVKDGKST